MNIIEEGSKVASATVDAMRSVPLAIALLVVNVGFLCFAGYVLGQVAANAGERNRSQMELIGKLVHEFKDCNKAGGT
jgi:hypothetical protein